MCEARFLDSTDSCSQAQPWRSDIVKPGIKGQRLIAAFLLGCLVFNYPILALFNQDGTIYGIPVLFVYIFGIWLLLIVVMMIIIEMPD